MREDYEYYHTDPYDPDESKEISKMFAREWFDMLNKPLPLAELVERVTASWGGIWSADKILAKCKRWSKKDWEIYEKQLALLGLV